MFLVFIFKTLLSSVLRVNDVVCIHRFLLLEENVRDMSFGRISYYSPPRGTEYAFFHASIAARSEKKFCSEDLN